MLRSGGTAYILDPITGMVLGTTKMVVVGTVAPAGTLLRTGGG